MSHTYTRRSRLVSVLVASVVVLAACGGGESTRTRNNAIVKQDCHASPVAKQQAIDSLTQQITEAENQSAERDRWVQEQSALGGEADEAQKAYVEYLNSIGGSPKSFAEMVQSGKLWSAYLDLLEEFTAVSQKALDALNAGNRLTGLRNALSQLEKKPLCGGDEGASPGTSSAVDDVTTTSGATDQTSTSVALEESTTSTAEVETSTTNAITEAPTTSVESGDTSTTSLITTTESTTAAAETTTTTTGSGDGEPQVTLVVPTDAENQQPNCGAPEPDEGTVLSAPVGETITVTVPLCDDLGDGANMAYGFPGPVSLEKITRVGSKVKFELSSTSNASIDMFVSHYNDRTFWFGPRTWLRITFGPTDPCEGKQPDASWDADKDGGTFVGTSTCESSEYLRFLVIKKTDDGATELCRGFLTSGTDYADLINRFGAGTYDVLLTHAVPGSDSYREVGDTRSLTIEYTPPADSSTSSTLSGAAMPADAAESLEVVKIPTAVFSPLVSEPVENPRAADASVPVVAVPAEATVMTCDQGCIDAAISAAGLTDGTVEISIGTGAWQQISESSLFALPVEPVNVRLRVTPSTGDPVVMSAVVTRESTQQATSELAYEVLDDAAVTTIAPDDGSSFPWWILILIAVLLALAAAEVARRRKTKKDATTV